VAGQISSHWQEAFSMSEFISDLAAIRDRARKSIEDGAVTGAYKGERE
jgi:hypothetical protein